jgi:hypothetical protein
MSTSKKLVGIALALTLAFGGAAAAYGNPLKTMDRDHLKDGSCIAADQNRAHLRDGSCVAADQLRTRLKDGTCVAADQLRTRAKDASC